MMTDLETMTTMEAHPFCPRSIEVLIVSGKGSRSVSENSLLEARRGSRSSSKCENYGMHPQNRS